MKTKKYFYAPHKTGFTREQHDLLRRGEVLVIDYDGLVGRGHLPEELYYAWGRPNFHKHVKISGYDTFHGWGEEYERGTCLIYGTPGTVWEFVLPNGLTLEDYLNYYECLTYDSFKVTREGYSAVVLKYPACPCSPDISNLDTCRDALKRLGGEEDYWNEDGGEVWNHGFPVRMKETAYIFKS